MATITAASALAVRDPKLTVREAQSRGITFGIGAGVGAGVIANAFYCGLTDAGALFPPLGAVAGIVVGGVAGAVVGGIVGPLFRRPNDPSADGLDPGFTAWAAVTVLAGVAGVVGAHMSYQGVSAVEHGMIGALMGAVAGGVSSVFVGSAAS